MGVEPSLDWTLSMSLRPEDGGVTKRALFGLTGICGGDTTIGSVALLGTDSVRSPPLECQRIGAKGNKWTY